jgi:hypothetical protein
VSTSFPLMALARAVGLPYGVVLSYADSRLQRRVSGFAARGDADLTPHQVSARIAAIRAGAALELDLRLSLLLENGAIHHPHQRIPR